MTRAPDADHGWTGPTYYGRPQVKPAPFDPWVVGGYIFLAGLSGSAALLGAMAERSGHGRPRRERDAHRAAGRQSRYLSLLAPTLGSALLVYDLHTPSRFYNMLRVAKKTSPMSIGTWILMTFSAFAGISGAAEIVATMRPRWRWLHPLARSTQLPAAVAGAGLSTYTAALLSATSTPVWAAAPRSLAMRFGSSSMATGAAALLLGQAHKSPLRRKLGTIVGAALTSELVATTLVDRSIVRAGIGSARRGRWSSVERIGGTYVGVLLPLLLLGINRRRHHRSLDTVAAAATIVGSAVMRVATLGMGMESAADPTISMRFAQADNLPNDLARRTGLLPENVNEAATNEPIKKP